MDFFYKTLSFEFEVRDILKRIYWANKEYKEGNFLGEYLRGLHFAIFDHYKKRNNIHFENYLKEKKQIYIDKVKDMEDELEDVGFFFCFFCFFLIFLFLI